MSGTLASRLCHEFAQLVPAGWTAAREVDLFSPLLARRIGYRPQADVVLVSPRGERVVIELEVSRADPVANQAKVLLAFTEGALGPRDTFVSMLSPHLQAGRRNLAALLTRHMRADGLSAFCVSLLPFVSAEEIPLLNHGTLAVAALPAKAELARVLAVSLPIADDGHRIHFAGDVSDVIANLWRWNDELAADTHLSWERRRTQYFVHDPATGTFAPSKFCAFLPARGSSGEAAPPTMTHAVYARLGEGDPRFDGHRARRHLAEHLAFEAVAPTGELAETFERWRAGLGGRMALRESVTILQPPRWYARR